MKSTIWWILIFGGLVVLWLVTVFLNWVYLIPEHWKLVEGKDFWSDLKLALMVALPVFNWAVLITTVWYWFVFLPVTKGANIDL